MTRFLFITFFSCLLLACQAEMQNNVIQGNLYNNCDYGAVDNVELLLSDMDRQGKIIASDISSADGSFLLSYDMDEDKTGNLEISYFNGSFYQSLISSVLLNQSYTLDLLVNNTATVAVGIQTDSVYSSDTLFYSLQASNKTFQIIHPSNSKQDTLIQVIGNSILTESTKFYWGLGKVDFNKAKKELNSTNYHQIPLQLKSCQVNNVLIKL